MCVNLSSGQKYYMCVNHGYPELESQKSGHKVPCQFGETNAESLKIKDFTFA